MHFQRAKRLANTWIDGLVDRKTIAAQIRTGNLSRNVMAAAFSERGLRRFACRMLGAYRDSILAIEQVQWSRTRKTLRVRLVCADDVVFDDGAARYTERCACLFDFVFTWSQGRGWHPASGCLSGTIGRHCLMRILERNLPNDTLAASLSDQEVIERLDEMMRQIGPMISEAARITRLALSHPAKGSSDPPVVVPFGSGLLLGILAPDAAALAATAAMNPSGAVDDSVPLHIRTFCDKSLLTTGQEEAFIEMSNAIKLSRTLAPGGSWTAGMNDILGPLIGHLVAQHVHTRNAIAQSAAETRDEDDRKPDTADDPVPPSDTSLPTEDDVRPVATTEEEAPLG